VFAISNSVSPESRMQRSTDSSMRFSMTRAEPSRLRKICSFSSTSVLRPFAMYRAKRSGTWVRHSQVRMTQDSNMQRSSIDVVSPNFPSCDKAIFESISRAHLLRRPMRIEYSFSGTSRSAGDSRRRQAKVTHNAPTNLYHSKRIGQKSPDSLHWLRSFSVIAGGSGSIE